VLYTYFADDNDAVSTRAPLRPLRRYRPHHRRSSPKEAGSPLRPEDYWYEQKGLGDPFWASEFEIVEARTIDAVWKALGPLKNAKNAAYIGNEIDRARAAGLALNPEKLVSRLDWDRAYKTDYEIQCLDEATALGAKGHRAAARAFEAGASELEIHYAFVQAMEATEDELPYTTIVALNEKAAFLHYHNKRGVRNGDVLLIDAGAKARGYASDITRTHVSKGCNPKFTVLRDGVEKLQQELCGDVRPGIHSAICIVRPT
jgi:Xaa-Pro dipeptidase